MKIKKKSLINKLFNLKLIILKALTDRIFETGAYGVPTLQAGIEFKKNLRVRFGNYGGLKLGYFWVVKSKKAKSFIRG